MSAWSQLPNAAHIDRILESLKTHPDIWAAAAAATAAATAAVARDLLWHADWRAAWFAARDVARDVGRDAAWDPTRNTVFHAILNASRRPIAALIAWDDSAQFLEMTEDALEVWIRISDDPRAVLLLPAVRAFERIKELETL